MAIKRYIADYDNTITNAYESNLTIRGTGSNMGASDILESFTIYGQASSTSSELSRILVQFPITDIISDRAAGTIPASGSASFYLRLYNAPHSQQLPRGFTMLVRPVSTEWEEGTGLDMDSYSDLTYDGTGSNWIRYGSGGNWTSAGGDYHSDLEYTQVFDKGTEDLEIDISDTVEQWIDATKSNYGLGISMTASHESAPVSYYTKKFFGRGSEYYFKRPSIEARWDSSRKDHRGNFNISSSVLSATDNLQTFYIYNRPRGSLTNINGVGTGEIYVKLYADSALTDELTPTPDNPVTGGYVETGIYSASFALETTASTVYDKWYDGSSTTYYTDSFEPNTYSMNNYKKNERYVLSMPYLKPAYSKDEEAHFRVYSRQKNWRPSIYTVATQDAEISFVENLYYRILRTTDLEIVVDYGTGSSDHTKLSYDKSGSYFDFDCSMLESGYMYTVNYAYKLPNGLFTEAVETFNFRVEE